MQPHNCLFLVENIPLSRNAGVGVSALNTSHLEMLLNVPCSVHLVRISDASGESWGLPGLEESEGWEQLKGRLSSYHTLTLHLTERRLASPGVFLKALADPFYLYSNIAQDTLNAYAAVLAQVRPSLVWAEHLTPATLARQASGAIPVVYSHHDWKWRIKQHRLGPRANAWVWRFRFWLMRRFEEALVRDVAGCVSGSATEISDIRTRRTGPSAYFPTTYQPSPLPEPDSLPDAPRIVHLGGMRTTANRLGLERFLDVTWPALRREMPAPPELWVVGSLEGAPRSLLDVLEREGATCTGFVEDLDRILRPYDIHIIPWEFDTGTRTRIPLALNYGQVVVSTQAAAGCLPELAHGKNCLLVDDLQQMAVEIKNLASDPARRKRLGQAARETFLASFTREALQPRFDDFIRTIVST